jgi:hypothetical protein
MLHGSSILHYSLFIRVLLIGILVHLISLLNVNEELCIGFALLKYFWCYVIKSCHPLFVCILLCCFGCGRFDYMAVQIEGSLLNVQPPPHNASSIKHDERSLQIFEWSFHMTRPSNRGVTRVQHYPWLLLWASALRSLHMVRPSNRGITRIWHCPQLRLASTLF